MQLNYKDHYINSSVNDDECNDHNEDDECWQYYSIRRIILIITLTFTTKELHLEFLFLFHFIFCVCETSAIHVCLLSVLHEIRGMTVQQETVVYMLSLLSFRINLETLLFCWLYCNVKISYRCKLFLFVIQVKTLLRLPFRLW